MRGLGKKGCQGKVVQPPAGARLALLKTPTGPWRQGVTLSLGGVLYLLQRE